MGGAFSGGGGGGSGMARAIQTMQEKQAAATKPTFTQDQQEQGARTRGARRRGRQLLADTRLGIESNAETLGGGQNLG